MLPGIPTLIFYSSVMQKLFVSIICICILLACQTSPKNEERQTKNELTFPQRMVVTYLSYPQFVQEDFPQQFFDLPIQIEKYRSKTQVLYLSMPKDGGGKAKLTHICDTSLLTFAVADSSGFFLDPYVFQDKNKLYFSLPTTALLVDGQKQIHQQIGDVVYEATLDELAAVFSGEKMFNGPALAKTHELNHEGQHYVVGNHCATISPKGEPSLQRLAARIIDSTATREEQAQQLLDFVTRHINYTGDAGMEIFRRPTEVLLSQKADCSGKVVLYASLLEQIDYPYLLVYLPRHIALAIPGDFSDKNGMHFVHEGETYYFAETTSKGFLIGLSYFNPPLQESNIEYLQYPGKATKLYDIANGDSLEFAKR